MRAEPCDSNAGTRHRLESCTGLSSNGVAAASNPKPSPYTVRKNSQLRNGRQNFSVDTYEHLSYIELAPSFRAPLYASLIRD